MTAVDEMWRSPVTGASEAVSQRGAVWRFRLFATVVVLILAAAAAYLVYSLQGSGT